MRSRIGVRVPDRPAGLLLAQGSPVLDRFCHMRLSDGNGAGQVSHGTRYLEYPVIGTGGPLQSQHRQPQYLGACRVGLAVAVDVSR